MEIATSSIPRFVRSQAGSIDGEDDESSDCGEAVEVSIRRRWSGRAIFREMLFARELPEYLSSKEAVVEFMMEFSSPGHMSGIDDATSNPPKFLEDLSNIVSHLSLLVALCMTSHYQGLTSMQTGELLKAQWSYATAILFDPTLAVAWNNLAAMRLRRILSSGRADQ